MRLPAIIALGLLAGCMSGPTTNVDQLDVHVNRPPNTAPRGSDEFCRIYASQTAVNRIEASRNGNGGGANGFDRLRARQEGDRAYERCRAGRTN